MTDGSATVAGAVRAGASDWRPAVIDCAGALAAAVAISAIASGLPAGVRFLAGLAAVVVAQGALYRRIFGKPGGLRGLRWGRDEWRLLGAHLMTLGLFLLIGAILLVIIGGVALGVARAGAPDLDVRSAEAFKAALANAGPVGLIAGVVPLVGLAILIWMGLRLSLTAPATVAESGVRVLSAFPRTRGKVLLLLGVTVVLASPVVAAAVALRAATMGQPVIAALLAVITYFCVAPTLAGALASIYRHSAAPQDA